jgi:hypothetical protein
VIAIRKKLKKNSRAELEPNYEKRQGYMLYREPTDYETGAGTKFKRGDIVEIAGLTGTVTTDLIGEIGIVIHNPDKLTTERADTWEDFYNIELLDRQGGKIYIYHQHVHET